MFPSADGRERKLAANLLRKAVVDLRMPGHGRLLVRHWIGNDRVPPTLTLNAAAVTGQMPHQFVALHWREVPA